MYRFLTPAAFALLVSIAPVQAVMINLGGTDYDITTVSGTYDDFSAAITATPWWNEPSKAAAAADQVPLTETGFGYENGDFSPYFAHTGLGHPAFGLTHVLASARWTGASGAVFNPPSIPVSTSPTWVVLSSSVPGGGGSSGPSVPDSGSAALLLSLSVLALGAGRRFRGALS